MKALTKSHMKRIFLALWFLCLPAYSQGTIFCYTYSGDTSPLNLTASFTATWDAVATRALTTNNFISGWMQSGERRVPIALMYFPVTSPQSGGIPLNWDGKIEGGIHYLQVHGLFGVPHPGDDWVEIDDGADRRYGSEIKYDVGMSLHYEWPSDGWWSVTIIPEPRAPALLLAAGGVVWLRRLITPRVQCPPAVR